VRITRSLERARPSAAERDASKEDGESRSRATSVFRGVVFYFLSPLYIDHVPTMLLRRSLPRLVGTGVTVLALIRRARKRNEPSIILPWRENSSSVIRQLTFASDDKEFRSIGAARTRGKLETVHETLRRNDTTRVFRLSTFSSDLERRPDCTSDFCGARVRPAPIMNPDPFRASFFFRHKESSGLIKTPGYAGQRRLVIYGDWMP